MRYFYFCFFLWTSLQNRKMYITFLVEGMSQNGAGEKKQEQFEETLYFTLVSPETLEKFRHLRPKKELWNTS